MVGSVASALLLSSIAMPAFAQTGDSVTGSGAAGTGTFTVNATSGPSGENATGTYTTNLAIGTIIGTVTCLTVSGNTAAIGGVIEAGSTAAAPGTGFVASFKDNAGTGNPDVTTLQLSPFTPGTTCPAPSFVSPAAVTAGDVVIVDTVAPPPADIPSLISLVQSFGLDNGTQTSLLAKLNAASSSNQPAQCNQLSAFSNEVNAQAGNKITQDQATSLLQQANAVAAHLGCQ